MDSFKIIKKCISGIKVIGYVCEGDNGVIKTFKTEDVKTLCKMGKISNAELLSFRNSDETYLVIYGDIPDKEATPKEVKYKVHKRVVNNEKCVGYILKDREGNKGTVSLKKAWSLSHQGEIKDLQATINENYLEIKAVGDTLLENIPTVESEISSE